jgi:hypothetical protein
MDRPVENLFSYQITYPDGGGATWSGPPMIAGDRSMDDERTTYFNDAIKARVPIPDGYSAPPRVEDPFKLF